MSKDDPRPATLQGPGWQHRVRTLVKESGVPALCIAREACLTPAAVCNPRAFPNSTTILALDDWCAGALLDPAERAWAERTQRRYLDDKINRYARSRS